MTPVTSVHTGLLFYRILAGKFNVWRRQDGAGYFVSSNGTFVHKYPLIFRYNDWFVLEIITHRDNGQGKRFCSKEKNTCIDLL